MRALLLGGLLAASPAGLASAPSYYLVDTLAAQTEDAGLRAEAQQLASMHAALARQAGIEATLVYSTDPQPNAFATEVDGQRIVVLQQGLLSLLEGDRDALAAVLGHELAHHRADHVRAGHRRQEGVRALGRLLGAVVSAHLGDRHGDFAGLLGGAAVGVGANLVALKFSRSQELEADRLGIEWMLAAGHDPDGMLRLQARLGALQGGRQSAILSTHPTSAARLQAAERHIVALAPDPALRRRPPTPLADPAAVAAAETQIRALRDAQIAAALQPRTDASSATAMSPIAGIDLATFAALSSALDHAGRDGEATVLARFGLDAERLAAARSGFAERMRNEPALAERYSAAYLRASEGPLAGHGRDLAAALEAGRPLQLPPPYPIETAKTLLAAVTARGATALQDEERAAFEAEVLQPHGLRLYDFMIGHQWWSQQARIAAREDGGRLLQDYLGVARSPAAMTRARAAEHGVHFGENVKIGRGVKVGGQQVED